MQTIVLKNSDQTADLTAQNDFLKLVAEYFHISKTETNHKIYPHTVYPSYFFITTSKF